MIPHLRGWSGVVLSAWLPSTAWLMASLTNTFVGIALEPAPRVDIAGAWMSMSAPVVLDAVLFGRTFGIRVALADANRSPQPPPPRSPDRAGSPPRPATEADPATCYTCAPVHTALPLQLLATMVANERGWSGALITDVESHVSARYQIGDTVRVARLYDVSRDPNRVLIENRETHRLEYIDGVGTAGPLVDIAPPAPLADHGIHRIDETHRSITRDRLEAALARPEELASQVRVMPAIENGQSKGMKLFSIRPDSVFGALGLQNADVVQSVNGYDIGTADAALQAYGQLRTASHFDVVVERHGTKVDLNYGVE